MHQLVPWNWKETGSLIWEIHSKRIKTPDISLKKKKLTQENRVQSHSDECMGTYTTQVTPQSNGGMIDCLIHGVGEK